MYLLMYPVRRNKEALPGLLLARRVQTRGPTRAAGAAISGQGVGTDKEPCIVAYLNLHVRNAGGSFAISAILEAQPLWRSRNSGGIPWMLGRRVAKNTLKVS
jgi:hypothetical protein